MLVASVISLLVLSSMAGARPAQDPRYLPQPEDQDPASYFGMWLGTKVAKAWGYSDPHAKSASVESGKHASSGGIRPEASEVNHQFDKDEIHRVPDLNHPNLEDEHGDDIHGPEEVAYEDDVTNVSVDQPPPLPPRPQIPEVLEQATTAAEILPSVVII
ncbi:hypothetical protein CDD83_7120 [Cordyceps sp. RAO-2017]|nr:hypothetical protein CDD83_7120 [Cordyceps sp. RAO-2017]